MTPLRVGIVFWGGARLPSMAAARMPTESHTTPNVLCSAQEGNFRGTSSSSKGKSPSERNKNRRAPTTFSSSLEGNHRQSVGPPISTGTQIGSSTDVSKSNRSVSYDGRGGSSCRLRDKRLASKRCSGGGLLSKGFPIPRLYGPQTRRRVETRYKSQTSQFVYRSFPFQDGGTNISEESIAEE